jgi:Ca2+-binding RTX toxin-like protein
MKKFVVLFGAAAFVAALMPLTTAAGAASSPAIVKCAGVDVTIVGTDGDDNLVGDINPDKNDVFYTGKGNDRVRGLTGDDLICGGDGNDILIGGTGFDTIYGGPGHDELHGQGHDDVLYGYGFGDPNDPSPDDFFDGRGFDQEFGGLSSRDNAFQCADAHPTDPATSGIEVIWPERLSYC